jgi:hypothetical protein
VSAAVAPSAMATAIMMFGHHGLTHRLDPGLIRAELRAATIHYLGRPLSHYLNRDLGNLAIF